MARRRPLKKAKASIAKLVKKLTAFKKPKRRKVRKTKSRKNARRRTGNSGHGRGKPFSLVFKK